MCAPVPHSDSPKIENLRVLMELMFRTAKRHLYYLITGLDCKGMRSEGAGLISSVVIPGSGRREFKWSVLLHRLGLKRLQ